MTLRNTLALTITFFVLSACGKPQEAKPEASAPPVAPTNVQVLVLRGTDFAHRQDLTGIAEPWKVATIAAELGGKLESFQLSEGRSVSRGQVVARLNGSVYAAQRDQAAASYRLSQLQEQWQQRSQAKQVAAAETSYDEAATSYARQRRLYAEEVVSAQTHDSAQSALTQSRLQMELSKVGQASTYELNRQQSRVAQTNLQLAKVQLAKTAVTSPISGYVNRVSAEAGEVVNPGQALAEVLQMSPVKLTLAVPERDIASVRMGAQLNIRFDALPGVNYAG
ncbi:MAG: hypothetical protein CVV27_07325, partial [Candidatus Melainabacteria bacterium HGW-Melainabacteria-1]